MHTHMHVRMFGCMGWMHICIHRDVYMCSQAGKECSNARCQHGRVKYGCKECGGSGLCVHGRQKSKCKECGGSGRCHHGRLKSQCKECGGASICMHGRQRYGCKLCGGAGICPHGRHKSICKECGGSGICPHMRLKSDCKDCGGSGGCTAWADELLQLNYYQISIVSFESIIRLCYSVLRNCPTLQYTTQVSAPTADGKATARTAAARRSVNMAK